MLDQEYINKELEKLTRIKESIEKLNEEDKQMYK